MSSNSADEFKKYIRDIPDFPQKGIIFRDITNLLKDGEIFKKAIDTIAGQFQNEHIDLICSVEARGFMIGSALAHALGAGFVPIRKKGKLPWDTHQESYELEYGTDEVEIHTDAFNPGHHVLFVDDVIATGGTAKASLELIKRLKGKLVAAVFLIELTGLGGKERLGDIPVYSLMQY